MVACRPGMDGVLTDDQNPYITAGLNYRAALEYDSAINAFEKALEENSHSVRAHYELGLLYDKEKHDYVTAIYHYNRVLKLQPTGYPSENVRLLIAGCRQELIKAEALAPVARTMQSELEKLRRENQALRDQLENLKAQYAAAATAAQNQVPTQSQNQSISQPTARSTDNPAPNRANASTTVPTPIPRPVRPDANASRTVTPAPRSGSPTTTTSLHTVRAGETMASISRLYRVSLTALISANPGIDPRRIRPGQVVRIPAR